MLSSVLLALALLQPPATRADSLLAAAAPFFPARTDTVLRTVTTTRTVHDTVHDTVRVFLPIIPTSPMPPIAARIDSVPMVVARFDTSAGDALVSSALPLPPGRLSAATLASFRVVVAGTERAVSVTPLVGRWPDSSYRAVLVQFRATVAKGGKLAGFYLFGGTRKLADLQPVPAAMRAPVVALPTSVPYLLATRLGGALAPAYSGPYARWDSLYATTADAIWKRVGPSLSRSGAALYNHPAESYAWWLRTGDPAAWDRARQQAAAYQDFAAAAGGVLPAWNVNTESLLPLYYTTGDPAVRAMVGTLASTLADALRDGFKEWPPNGSGQRLGGWRGDDRARARTLQAFMDAAIVQAPAGTYYRPDSSLTKGITDVLSTQHADGSWGGQNYAGSTDGVFYPMGTKSYMSAMLAGALTRYYDETGDVRVPLALSRWADFAWANLWVPSALGMHYVDRDSTSEGIGQRKPHPELNGFAVDPFALVAATRGAAGDWARVDSLLAGAVLSKKDWPTYSTVADQVFYRMGNAMARR